jgi:hypothetical protein
MENIEQIKELESIFIETFKGNRRKMKKWMKKHDIVNEEFTNMIEKAPYVIPKDSWL